MIISVQLHVIPSLEYPVSNFKLIMSAESSVRSRGLWPASMRLKSAASADPVSPPPPEACLLSHLHYFAAWPCHREVGSGLHLDKNWGLSCQVDGSLGDAGQSHYPIIPQSSCPQSFPAQAPWQDCRGTADVPLLDVFAVHAGSVSTHLFIMGFLDHIIETMMV